MKDRLAELRKFENAGPGTRGSLADGSASSTSSRPSPSWASTWYDQTDSNGKSRLLVVKSAPTPRTLIPRQSNLIIKAKKIVRAAHRRSKSPRVMSTGNEVKVLECLQEKMVNIQDAVKKIQNNTRQLAELHTNALMSPSITSDDQMLMDSLERDTRTAFKYAAAHIKGLEGDPPAADGALQRMHSAQLLHARRALSAAIERHEAELKRYADGLRKLIARQISIARGASPADDVEDCIVEGHLQFFIDNYHAKEQEARTTLANVSERHHELAELEKSISQVRDLFGQVMVLVLAQGDMVDNIEAHVLAAADQVTDGRKQLKSAKTKQKSARKKKMLLGGIGAGVLAALVVIVAVV